MATIATLLESRAALLALRRTLPKSGPGVVACRTPAALRRVLERRLVDAVVLCPSLPGLPDLAELRSELPGVQVVAYAPFRPDDGELLLACRRHDVALVAVEGVDDSVVGDMVARSSITAARRRAAVIPVRSTMSPTIGSSTPSTATEATACRRQASSSSPSSGRKGA